MDFERGLLLLPDSKTGRKPAYLSAATLSILSALPRKGNPHIIAGAKDGESSADLKKPWAAFAKAAGLEGVRLHDLRHSFASIGGRVTGPADHRQAAWPFSARDDGALCASGRGPDAACGRSHRLNDSTAMSSPSRKVVPLAKSR